MNQFEHVPGDSALIDKIVCEVKSQGAFDQFRRECMADVDTKPAYQNLRQRVEGSVASFLGGQQWRPDLNKNQLREKLRRHITDTGFLETGVERIVDQVVNPKINTVFLSTIEDISYKYLGIEKPKPSLADCMAAAQAAQPPPTPLHPPAPVPPPPPPHSAAPPAQPPPQHHHSYHHHHNHHTGGLTVDIPPGTGHTFLPTDDLELEAVSPDSDKTGVSAGDDSRNDDHAATVDDGADGGGVAVDKPPTAEHERCDETAALSNVHEDDDFDGDTSLANHHNRSGTLADDFESPDFEPLEGRTSSALSNRGGTIDGNGGKGGGNGEAVDDDGDNSKLSAISGLTSQDSIGSNRSAIDAGETPKMPHESFSSVFDDEVGSSPRASLLSNAAIAVAVGAPDIVPAAAPVDANATDIDDVHADKNPSHSAHLDHSSELSQVSSNSRLSIATTDRESPAGRPDDHCDEAQMPRFNENSSNSHNANAATDAAAMPQPAALTAASNARPLQTSFVDINKQDEIQFEGTRRHSICVDIKAEAAAADSAAAASSIMSAAPITMGLPMASPPPVPSTPLSNLPADTLQPLLPVAPPPVPSQMVPVFAANGATPDNGLKSAARRSQSQSLASSMSLSSCTSSSTSHSSSNLIIAETKSLTLNGDEDDTELPNHNGQGDISKIDMIVARMDVDDEADKCVAMPSAIAMATDADKPIFETDSVAALPVEPIVVAAVPPTTDDFKFETPAVDGGGSDSRDKSRETTGGKSADKSARHGSHSGRSHTHSSSSSRSSSAHRDKKSSTTSSADKDKDRRHRTSSSSSSSHRHGTAAHSSRDKDKRESSSHRDAKDSKSKDPKDAKDSSSSTHRSSSSSKSAHGRSSSSSSSKHHHTSSSSSSSHRHHSSSSTSKDTERNSARHGGDSKSSSSSSSSGKNAAVSKPKTDDKDLPGIDDACNPRNLERRRSNDQDSNDGEPSASNAGEATPVAVVTSTTSSTNNTQVEQTAGDDTQSSQSGVRTETAEDFVLPSPSPLPVLVDQILTGAQPTDIDLERLIAESAAAGSDPVLSSIQQTIASSSNAALKRPKVASNIYEARKLIKVRKQMERDEKKRLEQALVLAKQYLSANATVANTLGLSVRDGGQGVELEFACVTGARNAAPSISSPVKTATIVAAQSVVAATDDEDFNGFGAAVASSQPMRQVLVSEEVFDDKVDERTFEPCNDDTNSDSAFRGFDTADIDITVTTAMFVRQANELFAQCARFASERSSYSQSVHLHRADAHIIDTFRQLCVGDVWLYAGGSTARQAIVRRPETVAKLNQWTVDGHRSNPVQQQQLSPDSRSRARFTRRPKSQSESRVAHKRTSPSDAGDVTLPDGFRPRRIKIDARIRMVSAAAAAASAAANNAMDTDDMVIDLETDDDGQSMVSDATSVTGGGTGRRQAETTDDDDGAGGDGLRLKQTSVVMQVSPTPSDQSVSSKENNFVPKIKKAVSRSLAHNSSVMAAAASSVSAPTASASPATIVEVSASAQQPLVALQKKASQQRYTSDDLYKPRPILSGSRSRRRGDFDNGDI